MNINFDIIEATMTCDPRPRACAEMGNVLQDGGCRQYWILKQIASTTFSEVFIKFWEQVERFKTVNSMRQFLFFSYDLFPAIFPLLNLGWARLSLCCGHNKMNHEIFIYAIFVTV